jgi:tetratricopeptide (TPR) repeat protein
MKRTGRLLVLGVLLAGPLAAQSPDERASIERLRAELAAITDSGALKAREAAGIEKAKLDRDNTMLHIELGFTAIRLGDLTGNKQHFDDAGSEFDWAAELKPEWPLPWYGLGLAELAQGEGSGIAMENLRQMFGKDYLTKAADAFAHATQADPTFAAALIDLAETALRQRINARLDVALAALRDAAHRGSLPTAVLLQLGRIEREAGSGDSALAAFRAYVAAGGDSGVGLFESAREQFDLGQPVPAESAYFSGARAARSAAAQAMYRQDVAWTATDAQLAQLDSMIKAGRTGEGLRRFWHLRDVSGPLRPGGALAEHERRFLYAWRHFRLVSRHRHYDVTETFRSEQTTFDDRGIIYIRQGEPDHRALYTSASIEPNESWGYVRPEGNLVFHFVAREDVQDFKLVRSVADVFGFDTALQVQTAPGSVRSAGALFASRAQLDPIYASLGAGGNGSGSLLAEERRRGVTAIRLGTTTEDYSPRFANRLEPTVETYALADTLPTGSRLLLVFSLSAKELEARTVQRGEAYPVEVRVSGMGEDGTAIYRDTTRVFVAPHALRGDEHLSWALAMPAPAGRYTLHMVVTQPGSDAGAVLKEDSVAVPPFGGADSLPQVSDLVAGRAGSGLVWRDSRDTIALNPLGTYPTEGAVDLYYEVAGLKFGEGYHTRIVVDREGGRSIFQRIFGGGGPAVHVEYDGVADSTMARVHQRVQLKGLKEGRYRLTLDVSVPTRETRHVRAATLIVQKP